MPTETSASLEQNRSGATLNILSELLSSTLPPTGKHRTLNVDREQIRREFYATYDVMTGVRIAATLGGFFGLVVLLVICKSKSKTQKALDDPQFAAVAAEAAAETEAMEQEEQVLKTVLEATTAWTINHPRASRAARRSLGNFSAPPEMWGQTPTPRFSSVSGNLMTPSVRSPGSALKFHKQPPCLEFDEDSLTDEAGYSKRIRRTSSATCSSSDSSYLERRGSSVVQLPAPPPLKAQRRKSSVEKNWDFYSIDIKVIQATPDVSPSVSERMLFTTTDQPTMLEVPRMAPLATISSCASSVLGTLRSDEFTCRSFEADDHRSLGSDSVFAEDLTLCDTDDEITPLGTDSEEDVETTLSCKLKRRCSAPVQRRLKQPKLSRNYDSDQNLVRRDLPKQCRRDSKMAIDRQLTRRENVEKLTLRDKTINLSNVDTCRSYPLCDRPVTKNKKVLSNMELGGVKTQSNETLF